MRYLMFSLWALCAFAFFPSPGDSSAGEEMSVFESGEREERVLLEDFFKELLSETTAGYVLYGSKPLYLNNIHNEKSLCIGTEWHKAVNKEEVFLDTWKDFGLGEKSSDFFLKVSNPSTDPSSLENELLLINRKALLEAIDKNIVLFQHKLGIQTTAEALFSCLMDPSESISSVFKGQAALLGIVLGYGGDNSICYRRGTNIIKSIQKRSSSLICKADFYATNEGEVIEKCKTAKINPSFGFLSIADEVAFLSESVNPPTNNYGENLTKIPFSYLDDSEESSNLLEMYRQAQVNVKSCRTVNLRALFGYES